MKTIRGSDASMNVVCGDPNPWFPFGEPKLGAVLERIISNGNGLVAGRYDIFQEDMQLLFSLDFYDGTPCPELNGSKLVKVKAPENDGVFVFFVKYD
jgi:hypothetical protein